MKAARGRRTPRGDRAEASGPGPVGAAAQVIHSGHFMVSSPHNDRRSCDFDTVNRRTCRTYRFGPRSRGRLNIDPSLSRLLECMTLAYSGKLVSPKWKTFKGLRLLWRDKIRLNNAIWRAWYTQYVEKRKNPVCGFITPLEGTEANEHHKPEAIVLEGNYWKRRIEVVIKEYHKWRIYFKKRLHENKDDDLSSLAKEDFIAKSAEKWSSQIFQDSVPMEEGNTILCDFDYLLSDISDTLFTVMQSTNPWPNAGEVVYTSNADIIQPDLTPLQPDLDELMDMQGFFSNHWLLHPQPALPEHSHFCNISSNPFGPGTPRVPAGNVLVDRQPPQADVLSDHGFRLGGALTDATISNDPSETIDSRNVMISRSRFQSPAYYEQRPEYLLPDALPAQQSCMASYSSTMVSAPSATICEQEPSYCSVPLQNPKYRYGPNVSPSVSAHPAPTPLNQHISALTFPPSTVLSPSPSSPLSFTTPSSVQLMAPLQQVPDFPLPKVQSLRSGSRRKYKTLSPELVSPSPLPSPVSAQNSDLTRLLLAGKREAGLSLTHTSVPPSPNSPTSALSEFPGTTLMKAAQQVLRDQPPQSSISYSVPFVIPKTERLSPSSASNGKVPSPSLPGGRHGSAQLSLNNSGEPRSATQPLRSTPSRTRPDSNKLESNWITHISAEQKRRFNIKLGFDTLHRLVTSLDSQPGVKVSKATTLRKTAEYIVKLQQERAQTQEEVQRIREDIEKINAAINICQQQLPATGVPVTRQRFRQMREMFSEYVRVRTLHNWKFWIFSIFIRPLFESFNGMVSTGSVDDLCQTALSWLEQHCSLPALRPGFKMADRLMTYETQFFRFSPQTGVLRVHSGIQDSLLDVMLVVERVILKKLKELPDNSLTPSQVRACTENFLQLMKERFDMIFERVEQGILQHIFYIPENILLPEDNVHEQYPYTEDQCQELQAEIAQLQHCYKSEIIAKHALLAELEDQKMIELKLEQRIHWFNSLDNTWKSNGVSSVPQSLTFVRELAQKIPAVLQKIKEKCKDEVRQSQAVSESEQEEG